MKIHRLQIILKTIERCNLGCTYCYYFFGGDESYKNRPPVIDMTTISQLVQFLKKGVQDLKIDIVEIIFHGGEPMLQKPKMFDEMCTTLREGMAHVPSRLRFAIQTNGTIVNEEWIGLLNKHDVAIGISIDGPREYNDKYRIDLKGKGSYQQVEKGVRRLFQARAEGRLSQSIGTLTVLNAEFDYKKIYHHLNKELNIDRFSFLLPDISYDSGFPVGQTAEEYGDILCDIFDQWVSHPGTSVRNIDNVLDFFQLRAVSKQGGAPPSDFVENQVIVIQSNGDIAVDDSLIPASVWRNELDRFNMAEVSLLEYLSQDFFKEISSAYRTIPDRCVDCAWKKLCRGGDVENRFSAKNGFNNPSIYCASLLKFYTHVAKYLVSNGYPVEEMEKKLSMDVV